MSSETIELAKPVLVDYEELRSGNLENIFPTLLKAFGDEPDCLGIILINMDSVPEYTTLRRTLLSYSSYLAALPDFELKKLENAHAKYVVGWSHGKERLKSGAVDTRKGIPSIPLSPHVLGLLHQINANHRQLLRQPNSRASERFRRSEEEISGIYGSQYMACRRCAPGL